MSQSFGELQCQSLQGHVVDLVMCTTMDLIAFIRQDGSLYVYRSLSWKRILSKTLLELQSVGPYSSKGIIKKSAPINNTYKPAALSFSPSGKLLAIGCTDSVVLILDIESGEHIQSQSWNNIFPAESDNSSICNDIVCVQWSAVPLDFSVSDDVTVTEASVMEVQPNESATFNFCNTTCVAPMDVGLRDIDDVQAKDSGSAGSSGEKSGFFDHPYLVWCITGSRESAYEPSSQFLLGYLYGVSLLYTVRLKGIQDGGACCGLVGGSIPSSVMVMYERSPSCVQPMVHQVISSYCQLHELMHRSHNLKNFAVLPCRPVLVSWQLEQRAVVVIMSMQERLQTMYTILTMHGKKWADATKVIIPKLNLLQSLLTGYEIELSPTDFMYSMVLCGHWHPACLTSFSTHWNAAGLNRLISGIDVTTRQLERDLLFRISPLATNLAAQCRELREIYRHITTCMSVEMREATKLESSHVVSVMRRLTGAAERLLFKMDDTILETKKARAAMLLYTEFIKESAVDPDAVTEFPPPPPDQSLRPKWLAMFDPRIPRHSASLGTQAEIVTGTFLYAYLRESTLPDMCVGHTQFSHKGSIIEKDDTAAGERYQDGHAVKSLQQFLSIADASVDGQLSEGEGASDHGGLSSSFVGQILVTRDIVDELLCYPCAERLSRVVDPSTSTTATAATSTSASHDELVRGDRAAVNNSEHSVGSDVKSFDAMMLFSVDIPAQCVNFDNLRYFTAQKNYTSEGRVSGNEVEDMYYSNALVSARTVSVPQADQDVILVTVSEHSGDNSLVAMVSLQAVLQHCQERGASGFSNKVVVSGLRIYGKVCPPKDSVQGYASLLSPDPASAVRTSTAVSVVGIAAYGGSQPVYTVFSIACGDMVFDNTLTDATAVQCCPIRCRTVTNDRIQGPILHFEACGARGTVSVVDANNVLVVLDMDQDDEDDSEDDDMNVSGDASD